MTRQDFLKNVSLGAAFVLTVPCLHSCSKDDDGPSVTPAAGVDLTIDVTEAPYADQLASRGYTVVEEVVIASLMSGGYAAASLVCSHEQNKQVEYDRDNDQWACYVHGAVFDRASGAPENDVTSNRLQIFQTELTGNLLRITS